MKRTKDLVYFVTHNPMARTRIVFVLDEPFDFVNRATEMAEAHKEWSNRLRGFFEDLDIAWDQACADPTHLMYLPRHDAEASGHEIRIVPGRALRIEEMPLYMPAEKKAVARPSKAQIAQRTGEPASNRERQDAPFATPNLISFVGGYGHDFEISVLLEELGYEDRGAASNGGRTFECPNEDNHSNPNEGRKRFFVRDASKNNGAGFAIHCAGDTCGRQFASAKDPSKQDRARWLDFICQKADIRDAMELTRYCPNADDVDDEADDAHLPEGYLLRNGEILRGSDYVCGELEIVGVARDQTSGTWSKAISFKNPDGVIKEILVANADLYGDCERVAQKIRQRRACNWSRPEGESRVLRFAISFDQRPQNSSCAKNWFPAERCIRTAYRAGHRPARCRGRRGIRMGQPTE